MMPDMERDILLLVVVNRYQAAKPALAFIEGFGLKQAALASRDCESIKQHNAPKNHSVHSAKN
jgi:adenine deaminase